MLQLVDLHNNNRLLKSQLEYIMSRADFKIVFWRWSMKCWGLYSIEYRGIYYLLLSYFVIYYVQLLYRYI